MDEQQRHLLIEHRKAFGDDLRAEDIFSYLQSKFVLDFDEVELIKYEKTSRRKVEKLLQMLPDKGPSAFTHFYSALIDAEYYHLAELLKCSSQDCTDSGGQSIKQERIKVETVLRDGGVPQKPLIYTARPEAFHLLHSALFQLQNSVGWVVLHGMAGAGKTVLASDVLRNAKLLEDCFPGGVYWIWIGAVDAGKLLMKMQNLCSWLDKSNEHSVPRNLEDARNILRTILFHQHPRSLLVLDDLWTPKDARYFDVQGRILVTSRYSSVCDHINGLVLKIPIPDSLNGQQSRFLLASHLSIPPNYLPGEANAIIKECKGSPLAIALIGALLKSHPTRWSYYLNQLKANKVSKLKSKLAYQYPSLYEAIDTTVINIPEDLKRKFQYFALFNEDTRIPANVFCILWDEEVIEVEDTMDELVAYSLIKRQPISVDSQYEAYGIHDLQLDYLKESMSSDSHVPSLKDLHRDLIDKYFRLCNERWENLKDDDYIHWYLVMHLVKSGQALKAAELITKFSWIAAVVKITDTPHLIKDFDYLMKNVNGDVLQELKDFRNFIGANSNLLSGSGDNVDVVQLALANPGSVNVYKRVKKEVKEGKENRSGIYMDWSNYEARQRKGSSNEPLLTVQHHTGAVFSCDMCPAPGSDTAVSCGGDSVVKIWNICFGEEIVSLDGHTDTVYCCRFSPDGCRVVTSSADKLVKIWSVAHGQQILSISGHQGDVYCCGFSPDGKTVASCSVDKTIRLWDSSTGFLLALLMGHTDGVNWCAFSSDGSKIVSASNDLTVKVWDSNTSVLLHSFGQEDDFYSFCAFHPMKDEIVAASRNSIQVFNVVDGSLLKHIVTASSVICIAHSADGKFAVSGHADSSAQIWNIDKEICVATLEGHAGFVRSTSLNHDGSKVVTASEDGTCKVWSIAQSQLCKVKLRKVFDVDFQSDAVYAVDSENRVKAANLSIRAVQYGKMLEIKIRSFKILHVEEIDAYETEALESRICCCALSRDRTYFCIGCHNGSFKVFLSENLELHWEQTGFTSAVSDCCFAKEGILIMASENGDIQVYDVATRQTVHVLSGHKAQVTKLIMFGDSDLCLSSSFDGTLKVWNLAVGTCVCTCTHNPNESLLCCDVSKDKNYLISGSAEGTAKLWDVVTGDELHVLAGHSDCVRCTKFAPASTSVLTGGDDGIIKLWDTGSGQCLHTFMKHNIWVRDLHFSDDGGQFLSVSDDIKLWSTTGLLQTFKIRGKFLKYVRLSSDFKKFVTLTIAGELYIVKIINLEQAYV